MTSNEHMILDGLKFSTRLLKNDDIDILQEFNTGFSLPEKSIGDYIKTNAFKDMISGDGVSYIVVKKEDGVEEVIAYYTLVASSLPVLYKDGDYEVLVGIPAVQIQMFAVKDSYQNVFYKGKPISAWIFKNIIKKIDKKSKSDMGIKAIYLYSLDSAKSFYLKNGMNFMEEYMRPFVTCDDKDDFMYKFIRDVKNKYEPDDADELNEAAATSEQSQMESLDVF